MPSKNRVKKYLTKTIYHIYNRGLDGREIFRDGEDFEYFQNILKRYLEKYQIPTDSRYKSERPYIQRHKQEMNLSADIMLLAYCLMADHFHLLIMQNSSDGITKLMRRVVTNYVMYFNRKYKRGGPLFENVYRAVILNKDEDVVSLSKYIHLNPAARVVKRFGLVETVNTASPEYYSYSSYQNYVSLKNELWVKPEIILKKMKGGGSGMEYKTYVEQSERDGWVSLKDKILEENQ